jgi:WD40 repeat protein
MGRILLSADKTKTIVVFSTFDKTKEPSGFDGSLPVVKADEFVCDIATKKCEATDSLEVAYKAVFGEVGEWFKGGMLQWYQWDSKKNILFGHLNGEGVGAASPVYVFNLNTRILQQTLGFNSLNNQEKRAGVPSGAFSPSLNEFVMVYSTGNTWSLLLYRSDDLTTPQKKYDISSMIDAGAEEVRSVAWSADEKNIVLSTTDQIYTFSLESGKSVLRYTDPAHSLYDPVQLSRSEKYIVFVNYLKATFYFEANQRITVLRTVDLQNNNKISELLVEDGLGLNNIP